MDMLTSIDIIPDLVPESEIFDTIGDAYAYLKTNLASWENTASSDE